MKAKFTSHSATAVTIEYTDACDVRQTRTFEQRGTYVWELVGYEGRAHQVTKRMGLSGGTLRVTGTESLVSVLRREYKAMQAADKRAMEAV